MELLRRIKSDNTWLGVALGVLGPLLGFLVFYLIKFFPMGESLAVYLNLLKANPYLIPKLMSVCLLANGAIFFFYTHYRKDETARGILVATLVYAIVIIILKIT